MNINPMIHLNGGTLTTLPPLSLYIHIPYCVRKCPYCDFNSHTAPQRLPVDSYIQALIRDLELELPRIWGRNIESIFIGGGTPSIFEGKAIGQLLDGVRARLRVVPDAEITLEANPGTVDEKRFQSFADAGVTRLSLGIQSFSDVHLHNIGRIHTAQDAHRALEAAGRIFKQVNADLMYGLPHQSPEEACADILTASQYNISHLSAYQLTLEPHTALAHNPPKNLPDEDRLIDIEENVHHCLQESHWHRYEVSAFARDLSCRCQHNLNTWQFGDYVGIGAGAHGKISSADGIERSVKIMHPNRYINAQNFDEHRQKVACCDLPFEFMLNALRLIEGVPSDYFSQRTGLPIYQIAPILARARQANLITSDISRLQTTDQGLRYLNSLLEWFLTPSVKRLPAD